MGGISPYSTYAFIMARSRLGVLTVLSLQTCNRVIPRPLMMFLQHEKRYSWASHFMFRFSGNFFVQTHCKVRLVFHMKIV